MKTIEWPKNPKECLKFTDDGGLAIIGERKNYKDAISIVSLRTVFKLNSSDSSYYQPIRIKYCWRILKPTDREWTLDSHFETDTEDFQMIRLNNHGSGSYKNALFAIIWSINRFYWKPLSFLSWVLNLLSSDNVKR